MAGEKLPYPYDCIMGCWIGPMADTPYLTGLSRDNDLRDDFTSLFPAYHQPMM
jgi:hypothetical protein